MVKYSLDKDMFSSTLCTIIPEMFEFIDFAILNKTKVNYADEFYRYILLDVGLDTDNHLLTFYFDGDIEKTIYLGRYTIAQSHSVPSEFYFTNQNDRNDYFVIIFNS